MKTTNVYVTRDSGSEFIEIWPDTVGIRKFHGCIEWGAAWCASHRTSHLYRTSPRLTGWMHKFYFKREFGFIPRKGTAWHIDGKGKRTKVDIDFSN